MNVYFGKQLNAIQYIGEEDRIARELLTIPLPTVKKGDILIVSEQTAKFLSRPGSPFEIVDITSFFHSEQTMPQVSDDAIAKVTKLNETIIELEGQLKIKEDELEAYELRENQEIEDLKKLNQELNKKLDEINKSETTKVKKTTKATKEETL